jgi:hypothetical protein
LLAREDSFLSFRAKRGISPRSTCDRREIPRFARIDKTISSSGTAGIQELEKLRSQWLEKFI